MAPGAIVFAFSGRRFNEVGNVENWWSSSSEAEFESRAQCFIDQYDRYTVSAGQVSVFCSVMHRLHVHGIPFAGKWNADPR